MRMRRASIARRAGFTIVELGIVLVIVVTILSGVAITLKQGSSAFEHGFLEADLETQAHRTLNRIVEEVTAARRGTLAPNPAQPWGSDNLQFVVSQGVVATNVNWSAPSRIQLVLESGEIDDGLDNNGNGLIDERRIQLVRNVGQPNEVTAGLGGFVSEFLQGEIPNGADDNGNGLIDEAGLSFELVGSTLTIRMTMEREDPDGGANWLRTVQTSVRLRN